MSICLNNADIPFEILSVSVAVAFAANIGCIAA